MLFYILFKLPGIIKTATKERKLVKELIKNEDIYGIISDNRFGVYSSSVPSVYITHQLRVFSGITTFFSSKIHRFLIAKYDACWIPDTDDSNNLSGKMGHAIGRIDNLRYLGIFSRFKIRKSKIRYDITVLLSGPEPQRTALEGIMLRELSNMKGRILLVRGTTLPRSHKDNSIALADLVQGKELEDILNRSALVIARPGYTTLMDLAVLKKKAFFIPTPGQYEQEYLAERMQQKGIAPCCNQKDFSLAQLKRSTEYSGFVAECTNEIFLPLSELFQRK